MIDFNLIYEKAKLVLISPNKFFKKYKKEKGLKEAFVYFAVLSFISVILGIIGHYLFSPYYSYLVKSIFKINYTARNMPLNLLVITYLIGWVLALITGFISAGFLHIYLLIFGGKAKYEDTYRLYSYSLTPVFLVKWVPVIGRFVTLWEIALLIIGTQKIHKMSRNKAILIYVIPLLLILLLIVIIFLTVIPLVKTQLVNSVYTK